jgi:dTDP-4-amino-4,6-dideoxygalactose transaminase
MMIHRARSAEAVVSALGKEGIQAVQYYLPVARNPVYRTRARFPVAEAIYRKAVYLPSSLNLTLSQVERICRIARSAP